MISKNILLLTLINFETIIFFYSPLVYASSWCSGHILLYIEYQPFRYSPSGWYIFTGWSAGWVSWCRIRTLRPGMAAAVNTAVQKYHGYHLRAGESKQGCRLLIFSNALAFGSGNLARAFRKASLCFGKCRRVRIIKIVLVVRSRYLKTSSAKASWRASPGNSVLRFTVVRSIALAELVNGMYQLCTSTHSVEGETAGVARTYCRTVFKNGVPWYRRFSRWSTKNPVFWPFSQSTWNFRPYSRAILSLLPPFENRFRKICLKRRCSLRFIMNIFDLVSPLLRSRASASNHTYCIPLEMRLHDGSPGITSMTSPGRLSPSPCTRR